MSEPAFEKSGGYTAFINITREMITRKIALLFPHQIMTVGILEDIEPDEPFMECCRDLCGQVFGS